ncbi:MAG: SixA phosphatase family protein [Nitritalea sp.]
MRNRIGIAFAWMLLVVVCFQACGPKPSPKTIYVVRHAEKLLSGDDPMLSVAGSARAEKLNQLMADKRIQHAFSTNYLRCLATLKPLADAQGIALELYDAQDHDALVENLRQREGNAIVVGHSNTIHHLVNYFLSEGQEPFQELTDLEYDFIFEIELKEDGKSAAMRKVYRDYEKNN